MKTNKTFQQVDKDKLKKMLAIKQAYTDGNLTVEEAKKRMKEEVGKISPEEFAAAEQLIKDEDPEECRREDVRTMTDIFDGLIPESELKLDFGHSIDAYRRENKALLSLLEKGDELLNKKFIKNEWLELMESIMPYKIHFSRKQNQLYSMLESKGFDRPTTTMWPYDDEIRNEMNEALQALKDDEYDKFNAAYKEMAVDLRDLIDKEELILYPTSLKLISNDEFEEMKSGDREIGFFSIDMPELEKSKKNSEEPKSNDFMSELSSLLSKYELAGNSHSDEVLDVAEGKLTLSQINLLFKHMPVDLSYVDENEIVKFYTDTDHRVFPRSKGVIGREVKNCHPPKSVHLVEEIIEKFRNGEQDTVDFWINKPDIFIYIKYVAIRDENGKFKGVLEMMQDATRIRKAEGSKTLLTWDEENNVEKDEDENNSNENENMDVDENDISITPNTKISTLLKSYPQLKTDLTKISSKFKMLNTPIAKVILPKATIQMISDRSGVPVDTLITGIKKIIASYN